MSISVPPHTESYEEAVTHGYHGARTDPFPDTIYVPGIQADLAPTITGVTPASGPNAGGTAVTITGTLMLLPEVRFDGTVAVITEASDDGTSLVATTPGGPFGDIEISVTTPGGTAWADFTYEEPVPPTLTGITPASGLAGSDVVLAGTGLATAYAVRFGALDGAVNSATDTSVTAATPVTGSGGPVDVMVFTDTGNVTLPGAFTFTPAGGEK